MRRRISLAAAFVACFCLAGSAYAGRGPGDVYNDFAQDGKLSCNHSRADLEAALRSGSINQYGDPYTLARLKLAVRRQLAGGCRRRGSSSGLPASSGTRTTGGQAGAGGGAGTGGGGKGTHQRSRSRTRDRARASQPQRAVAKAANESNRNFISERALIAVLLAGGLAIGGWLTRRALATRA